MKRIPFASRYRTSAGTDTSDLTLKKILIEAGYSEEQVLKMQAENRIFVRYGSLGRKIKGQSMELYIVERMEDKEQIPTEPSNRFKDIEID